MKNKTFLAVAGVLLASGTSLMAAPACSASAVLVTAATTCEVGNMIFSNFTTSGSPDAAMTVTYGITNFPTNTQYVVNFQDPNDITTSFGVSYTITVDQTLPPSLGSAFISNVGGGLQADTAAGTASATLTKTVTAITGTGGGTFTVVQLGSITTNNGPLTGLHDTSATIADSFAFTSGGFQNISNSFVEANPATTPEPTSMLLLGTGLLGLGFIKRRSTKKS